VVKFNPQDTGTDQVVCPQTLVARSHECDYPPTFVRDVPMLTSQKTQFNPNAENPAKDIDEQVRKALASGNSLYNLDVDQLKDLQPDVVLTQSLCEVCSIDLVTVERVVLKMKIPAKVLDLNPKTLGEVVDDIQRIGEVIGCEEGASKVVKELRERIERAKTKRARPPKVAFFEWTDPIYVGGHWTPEIIEMAGGIHLLNVPGGKSKAVHDEEFVAHDPDIIMVAPCGMDLPKTRDLVKHIENDLKRGEWFKSLRAFKSGKVCLVDGNEMFNRPGPRLVDSLEFCRALFDSFDSLKADEPFPATAIPFKFPWEPYI